MFSWCEWGIHRVARDFLGVLIPCVHDLCIFRELICAIIVRLDFLGGF